MITRVEADGGEETVAPNPPKPMTDAEIEAAALSDSECPPLSDDDLGRMRRVPRIKTLRRALGLTQQEFAERYRIPIGTLRDWEQGRSEPDQPGRNYLALIARDPEWVAQALARAA